MSGAFQAAAPRPSDDKRARLAQLLAAKAAEATTTWPLSVGQEALWFLHQTDPASAAYHTGFALRLRGALDADAMIRALRRLVARHAALRARFPVENGAPVQVVPGHLSLEVARVDAAGWTDGELAQRVAADYARPFDLAAGPLVRATLFECAPAEHVLLGTIHHIAGDAWTNWVLLDELGRLYGGECSGRPVELPPLGASYGDFARGQRAALAGAAGARWWDYWREQLAGDRPALALLPDFPRPAGLTHRGDAVPLDLPRELMAGVQALALAHDTTPFVVLLTAFHTFLYRHTGQEDIVVGTPTMGRGRAEFAGLAGYFVNPVPIRARPSGRLRFMELLALVREAVLGALDHAGLPLPVLVERLRLPRETARTPLFQALFVYQQPPPVAAGAEARAGWSGLAAEEFPLVQGAGQFELMLEIFEGAGANLKYHSALFTAETARRWARRFRVLLQGIVADPARGLDDLPLMDADERALVVREWNHTPAGYASDLCVHDLVAAQAARTPDAIAVSGEGAVLTYRELEARANQLAHWLRDAGVGPEVLVGVSAERSPELVVALLGVLKAGGAYVPLDPSYPRERLAFMREDAAVPVVLTQAKFADAWSQSGARVLRLDADWPEVASRPMTPPSCGVMPDHPAYMIYTSGSTGRPKGAVNSHRAIVNRLLWGQDVYRLTPADRVVQKTPFSFDVSVPEFFWPLLAGARLVLARPGGHQDAAYLADLFAREEVTTAHFVPSMLQVFVEEPGLARCRALRQVFCSGEALPGELAQRFLARHPAALHNLYGPTEAAVEVTFWSCVREAVPRPVPIGRPIAGTQMFVLDRRLRPVPVGVAGELHIGGIAVARGYHRQPELTAEKFMPSPFGPPGARLYRTGDLARWRADGALEYLGRLDHQVKLRGFRIELGEIEAALARQPGVREAIAIVREDRPGDRQLVAYLTCGAGGEVDAAALRRALRATLPDYMVPADFVVLPEMPLSPSGKIDRRALPVPSRDRPASAEFAAPSTATEARLAALWCEVLGRDGVGVRDNFFEVGGHSLLATQLLSRVREAFGVEVPLRCVFEAPTVAEFAAVISAMTAAAPAAAPAPAIARAARRPRPAAAAN